MIGINTGNAKLKTPQISHALAVFPQTAQRQDPMLPVAAAKTRMVLRNPSWKAVHGKRMTGHSQMAPSGLHSHLWLPQPKPAAVHGIMFEGPAKELDKDWDTLWFHTPKRSFKTLCVIFFGFTRLQPFDTSSHGCSLLQDLTFVM